MKLRHGRREPPRRRRRRSCETGRLRTVRRGMMFTRVMPGDRRGARRKSELDSAASHLSAKYAWPLGEGAKSIGPGDVIANRLLYKCL